MELPISVFYGTMAFFLALPILGFVLRMQIPISAFMLVSGGLLLSLLMATDTLLIPEENDQTTTITANGTGWIVEQPVIPFDFSLEGENNFLKVSFVFIAVMLILGGSLIELKQR